jgi:hypothetical protein
MVFWQLIRKIVATLSRLQIDAYAIRSDERKLIGKPSGSMRNSRATWIMHLNGASQH